MQSVRKTAAKLVDRFLDAVLAPERDTWALVLEGGAMRCIYTAGVLDSLHENCQNKFDMIVGVSAGAACAASFAAHQRGRMQDIFMNYLTDKRFLDYSRVFNSNKSILDLGFAIRDVSTIHVPLDIEALTKSRMKVFAGLTDIHAGEAEFLELNASNTIDALICSCNIPYLSRSTVPYQGKEYLDGGIMDPIPVRKAIEMGANKIVLILTQPHGFRQGPRVFIKAILKRFFGTSDKVEQMLRHEHTIYNNSKIFIELFESSDIELIVVSPAADFNISLLTRHKGLLHEGYAEGFIAGTELWKKLSSFTHFSQREPEKGLF
ncbi:MAG: patatin family protein [Lentisphaeraceae bacterium]|nr:patatin family protein [Lentisphaeraceae bacterium]